MTNPKDDPRFQYRCSKGHELGSEHRLERCPVYRRGKPCTGTLTRFGTGSKSDKAAS